MSMPVRTTSPRESRIRHRSLAVPCTATDWVAVRARLSPSDASSSARDVVGTVMAVRILTSGRPAVAARDVHPDPVGPVGSDHAGVGPAVPGEPGRPLLARDREGPDDLARGVRDRHPDLGGRGGPVAQRQGVTGAVAVGREHGQRLVGRGIGAASLIGLERGQLRCRGGWCRDRCSASACGVGVGVGVGVEPSDAPAFQVEAWRLRFPAMDRT